MQFGMGFFFFPASRRYISHTMLYKLRYTCCRSLLNTLLIFLLKCHLLILTFWCKGKSHWKIKETFLNICFTVDFSFFLVVPLLFILVCFNSLKRCNHLRFSSTQPVNIKYFIHKAKIIFWFSFICSGFENFGFYHYKCGWIA